MFAKGTQGGTCGRAAADATWPPGHGRGHPTGPFHPVERTSYPRAEGAGAGERTGRALLVSSTGGHLEELVQLRERFWPQFGECRFVTFDHPQSRSILRGQDVAYIPPVNPRDLSGALRALPRAEAILREYRPTAVISTGAGVAVPFLLQARRLGIKAHYIESAARTESPSLTGRMVARLPGVSLYSQYGAWRSSKWAYNGSVFDGFESRQRAGAIRSPRRIVVTLGTLDRYPFRRAVEAILPLIREISDDHTRTLWQVGDTSVDDLGIDGVRAVPTSSLRAELQAADLVFAHAGVGSSIQILDAGHIPVLIPRSSVHREHVDDHQVLVGRELEARGLAICRTPDALTMESVQSAMTRTVRRRAELPRFSLA